MTAVFFTSFVAPRCSCLLSVHLSSADAARDSLVTRFSADLESQVEDVGKELRDIGLNAQHEMILDDTSSPDQVR